MQTSSDMAVKAPESVGLGDLILAGGWLMIPLAILMGIAIFIFVERFIVISRSTSTDVGFMNRIRELMYSGKVSQAVKLCKSVLLNLSPLMTWITGILATS